MHDEVGSLAVVGPADGELFAEVAVLDQPGQLDDATQLHLTPATSGLGSPQCLDERGGLGAEELRGVAHRAHLLLDLAVRLQPVALGLGELAFDPAERLVDRAQELLGRHGVASRSGRPWGLAGPAAT